MPATIDPSQRCPCGTGDSYGDCCARFHSGGTAPTAEALMRSRYSAYALLDRDPGRLARYLHRTWDRTERPPLAGLMEPGPAWGSLTIVSTTAGGPFDDVGTVEFVAQFRDDSGARHRMHEVSRFRREDGRWLYVTGDVG
ncbi:YchJ family metal-binding protein [Zhihengliuella sp.]|uniref:YchJ family protein n=1 Tax=Zhihengliuella sp. TaxID=1954483 RepID=UPI00281136DC|nr:YchJ family metal-binding protein [Zhihengliuella sp.]